MDKLTLSRTLRTQLQQSADRDVRIEDTQDEPRILDDFELALAGGGDEVPKW
ncbi:MAG TPA: hypothetical protein VLL50_08715 [Usitatibacter sp.]|nr:hypothetical protein [Usitatibacter sp.]